MRLLPLAAFAAAACLFAAPALACDTVLPPEQRDIDAPGKYCLAANRENPIRINASDVELDCRGRTLTHRDDEPWVNEGVHLRGGSRVLVRNCRLVGWTLSMVVDQYADAQLLNNTVLANGPAISVHGSDRAEGDGLKLTGNRIFYYDARDGAEWAITINHSPKPVLTNNLVAGFRGYSAIMLNRAADAQLTGNQLLDLNEGGAAAVRMEQSPRARLVHNTVMLRRGVSAKGLVGASDATCIENVFVNVVDSGFELCSVRRHNVDQINND
ncbi:NosD domain-containing protein [Lysobacter enzymogenes]|uniref:NosD domain-containing protein n=1 Tax=Lysobacter enzymogenes TaxID=69 RepID=UPI001AF12FFC|nr:right-handed parallel beta-helix repeat-containing protein [Lysobacter enzymogenes]QQQ03589.1 right-handed parallel beta-helix repeat-containing protein [Lysobacter enzymogenes]